MRNPWRHRREHDDEHGLCAASGRFLRAAGTGSGSSVMCPLCGHWVDTEPGYINGRMVRVMADHRRGLRDPGPARLRPPGPRHHRP